MPHVDADCTRPTEVQDMPAKKTRFLYFLLSSHEPGVYWVGRDQLWRADRRGYTTDHHRLKRRPPGFTSPSSFHYWGVGTEDLEEAARWWREHIAAELKDAVRSARFLRGHPSPDRVCLRVRNLTAAERAGVPEVRDCAEVYCERRLRLERLGE